MVLDTGLQVMRFSIITSPQFYIDKFTFELPSDTTATTLNNNNTDNINIYRNQNLELVISMNNGRPLKMVNVYNITGSPVISIRNQGSKLLLPTASLPSGIYIVRVFTRNEVYSKKIIFR